MIEMFQGPVGEHTARGIAWRASCVCDARAYDATSRNGATTALARILVAQGVPDQPVQVYDQGRKTLFWPSLHKMAVWTYSDEGRRRWHPPPDFR